MVGWHRRLHGNGFVQILGHNEVQRSLVCWSPWSCKQLDMTERLKDNNLYANYPEVDLDLWIYEQVIYKKMLLGEPLKQ